MHTQFVRYAIVGLASNVFLYLVYLLITGAGIGHKTAMTALYVAGILITYLFNRGWTFDHRGRAPGTFIRYIAAYGYGYLFNLVMLYLLVDELGLPHQVVQGVLIFVVACIIFLLQKFWVFGRKHEEVPDYGA